MRQIQFLLRVTTDWVKEGDCKAKVPVKKHQTVWPFRNKTNIAVANGSNKTDRLKSMWVPVSAIKISGKARLCELWCGHGGMCQSSWMASVQCLVGLYEVLFALYGYLQLQHRREWFQMAASVTTSWLWRAGPQTKWKNHFKCYTSLSRQQLLERLFWINWQTLGILGGHWSKRAFHATISKCAKLDK